MVPKTFLTLGLALAVGSAATAQQQVHPVTGPIQFLEMTYDLDTGQFVDGPTPAPHLTEPRHPGFGDTQNIVVPVYSVMSCAAPGPPMLVSTAIVA